MHGRFGSIFIVAVCLGMLSAVATPAFAQNTVIEDIQLPFALPFYPGGEFISDEVPSFFAMSGMTMYFVRPLDDLTPRAGADALAMGGANIAKVEGPTAMSWNPAGLAKLRAPAFSLDGFHISSSATTVDLPETVVIPQMPLLRINVYENYLTSHNSFGFAGGATPLFNIGSRPLVGGLALRRHTDVAYGEELLLSFGLFEGTGIDFVYGHQNDERGAVYSNTASLGYELIRQGDLSIAAGVSANFLDGRLRSNQEVNINVRGWPSGITNFQRDYKGFSMEFGVQAEITDLVQVGGWMSMPYDLDSENSKFHIIPIISPQSEVTYVIRGEIADYTMEMPRFISGGIAVGPIKGIELAADVNYRPWSEVKIKHKESDQFPAGPGFISYSFFDTDLPAMDVTSFHIGGKFEFPLYREPLNRWGVKLNTLLGYRNLPLSMQSLDLVEGDEPYYFGAQVEGSAFSFGFNLETETRFSFSIGVEKQSYEFRNWFMYDNTDLMARTVTFADPWDRAPATDRSVTVFRFSTQMNL